MCLGKTLGARLGGANPEVLKEMVEQRMLGRKSGKGIFMYDDPKSKTRNVNPDAQTLIQKFHMRPRGWCVSKISLFDFTIFQLVHFLFCSDSTEDRQLRLISRFVNESILCLEEGILAKPVGFLCLRTTQLKDIFIL